MSRNAINLDLIHSQNTHQRIEQQDLILLKKGGPTRFGTIPIMVIAVLDMTTMSRRAVLTKLE